MPTQIADESDTDIDLLNDLFDKQFIADTSIEDAENPVVDARFMSYLRFYIADLLNADSSPFEEHNVIQIQKCFTNKVAICGNVVNVFDTEKSFRIKVDDSTGEIAVNIWKNNVFTSNSLDHSQFVNTHANLAGKDEFSELYECLNLIQKQIKEPLINNSIMYEPEVGDLVMITGQVRVYMESITLNAVSCKRIEDPTEEMMQIMLPAVLSKKIYSLKAPTQQEYDSLKEDVEGMVNKEKIDKKVDVGDMVDTEAFLVLVLKKLKELAAKSYDSTEACRAYSVFAYLKANCASEYSQVTQMQVLGALKELECRGSAYSCEDDNHYLPTDR